MLTGEIRGQIDRIWDSFWSGGIANPLEVIEQITYLLFIRRLDDLQTLEERKAARLKRPMARRIFPEGIDPRGRPYDVHAAAIAFAIKPESQSNDAFSSFFPVTCQGAP